MVFLFYFFIKLLTDFLGMQDNVHLEIGDTTISSITSNGTDKENTMKESPCGDAEINVIGRESREDFLKKMKVGFFHYVFIII